MLWHGTRQRGSLPSAKNKALGKEGFGFFLNILFAECLNRGTRQRHFEKKLFAERRVRDIRQSIFKKNLCRVPDLGHSAKKFFKKNSLPSARSRTLSKEFFLKKIFAECLTAGTRQRRTWPNTVTRVILCRVPRFCRESGTRQRSLLPSAFFCRVQLFAECSTRQRRSLPSARFLTLGKEFCTRQSLCFQ